MNSARSHNLSLKYQRFAPSCCSDIEVRKIEFVTKTQFRCQSQSRFCAIMSQFHIVNPNYDVWKQMEVFLINGKFRYRTKRICSSNNHSFSSYNEKILSVPEQNFRNFSVSKNITKSAFSYFWNCSFLAWNWTIRLIL